MPPSDPAPMRLRCPAELEAVAAGTPFRPADHLAVDVRLPLSIAIFATLQKLEACGCGRRMVISHLAGGVP